MFTWSAVAAGAIAGAAVSFISLALFKRSRQYKRIEQLEFGITHLSEKVEVLQEEVSPGPEYFNLLSVHGNIPNRGLKGAVESHDAKMQYLQAIINAQAKAIAELKQIHTVNLYGVPVVID